MNTKPEWTVTVVDRGRPTLILRARNRETGKVRERASGSSKRAAAEREAALWLEKLNTEGLNESPLFSEAAERFDLEYASVNCRPRTCQRFWTVFDAFQKIVGNPRLSSITETTLADFCRRYRVGRSTATLAAAVRHMRILLRWAHRQRLIPRIPHMEMPRLPDKAGGRPLTDEEVDRMLTAAGAVRRTNPEPWRLLIRGLYFSGLRIGEAVALSWDADAPVAVIGIETGRPQIRIQPEGQKNGKLTLSPAAPEFAELLLSIPRENRVGRVFGLPTTRTDNASAVISQIAKAAKVNGSAHDLRRSFACRWARRLPAQALQRLMRHSSLQTTMRFYATGDIGLEDALWAVSGDISGDKRGSSDPLEARKTL